MRYHVEIDWMSLLGNPITTTKIVMADSHTEALSMVRERVKNYKRCAKINGGSAIQIA